IAEDLLIRGMYYDSLHLLAQMAEPDAENDRIQKVVLEMSALMRLDKPHDAAIKLAEAERQCENPVYESCGSVLRARGILAVEQNQLESANTSFLACLSFAKKH